MSDAKIEFNYHTWRAKCPVCGKDYALPPSVEAMETQGLWSHMMAKHFKEERSGMFESFKTSLAQAIKVKKAEQKRQEQEQKAQLIAEKKEAHEAPKRKHVLTGAFLMDVKDELLSALEMMEPYYSQCDAGESGYAMVQTIEGIIRKGATGR